MSKNLIIGVVVCLIGGWWFFSFYTKSISADLAFIDVNMVEIRAITDGEIVSIEVVKGQQIDAGSLLVRLDKDEIIHQQAQTQADIEIQNYKRQMLLIESRLLLKQLDVLKKNMKLAEIKAEIKEKSAMRVEALNKSKIISPIKYEMSTYDKIVEELDVNTLNFEVKKIELAIESNGIKIKNIDTEIEKNTILYKYLATKIDKYSITSSKSGSIAEVFIQAGEYVEKGDLLAVIVPSSEVYIVAYFDERYLPYLKRGQPVSCHLNSMPDENMICVIKDIDSIGGAKRSNSALNLTSGYIVKTMQRIPVIINVPDKILNSDKRTKIVPGLSATISFDISI